MDEDASVVFELACLVSNIKKKKLDFGCFFEKYGKETHNMFFLDVQL
jgi:hypothetical protein